jgi:hypothetical protein
MKVKCFREGMSRLVALRDLAVETWGGVAETGVGS